MCGLNKVVSRIIRLIGSLFELIKPELPAATAVNFDHYHSMMMSDKKSQVVSWAGLFVSYLIKRPLAIAEVF